MGIQMGGITIDCPEPRKLAEFWAAALDYEVDTDHEGYFIALLPKGGKLGESVYVGLQKVDEPKAGKNRVHLDFHTEDRPAEVARLVELGATVLDEQVIPGLTWTVLADPEGNEFCVGSANG
ncbi:VOC family protein [Actinokineospora soli]|uniref:VOC family protein n=1 Tax=Actinokineospora soli TaxID=1048753 RepID=A0ABW2TTR9_9PSEU